MISANFYLDFGPAKDEFLIVSIAEEGIALELMIVLNKARQDQKIIR